MRSALLARWLSHADDPRPAVHDAHGTTSWQDLAVRADRIAAALLAGRRSLDGERVALLVSPGEPFVAAFFGVLRAGGTVVVLSPVHPPPESRYFCDDAGVRTVVASPDLADRAALFSAGRSVALVDALANEAARRATPAADPADDDDALQLYTSGTTGKPKGAILTHSNLAVQQALLGHAWGWRLEDVLLHTLPLHHMHGLAIAMLSAIGAGAATLFLPSFDARAAWDAMRRCSVFMAVPTIHAKLFAAFDAADALTRASWTANACALRLVTSGSAALPVSTGERWRSLCGAYPLERFGMTEIGVGASNPLTPADRRPGTVGPTLPTVKARIVDDELWVAGPSVFRAYHGREDETRHAFCVDGGERWFKTGDTVSCDTDGYLRILGRTSVDILKSGGYKLSAFEIEEALREHPAVADIAVVGVPDATWGERAVACVVAKAGRERDCSEDALRGFAKERLAAYKVPRQVVVMKELPRNAMGKVVKRQLVQALCSS
jgi:malonyl-CoA/methylmalonyl-CoA synthetase